MDPGLIFGPLGLVPAIFLLYFTLGPYETKFEDKIVFLSLIGGIVLGAIVLLIEESVLRSFLFTEGIPLDFLVAISLIFSFFDQLSKLIVANLPRFHRNPTTAIYGASFGIGFGTPAGVVLLSNVEFMTPEGAAAVLLIISFMLFHSSAGALMGLGVGIGKKRKYFLYSVLGGFFFWFMVILSRNVFYPLALVPFIFSLLLYFHIHRSLLPPFIIDRKTRREAQRQRKKRKLFGNL